MHIIYVIIVGFVAGLIARFLIPGPNNPSGFIFTTLLGIAGSLIANFLAEKFGWAHSGGISLLSGVVGAIILLLIYHLFTRNSATTY